MDVPEVILALLSLPQAVAELVLPAVAGAVAQHMLENRKNPPEHGDDASAGSP